LLGLNIAELAIWLDVQKSAINFPLPECHRQFASERPQTSGLYLAILNGTPGIKEDYLPIHTSSETWQLWQDSSGRYVFVLPDIAPPKRHIIVDPDFKTGVVIGEFFGFSDLDSIPYPLSNIEIKIFINWLAGFGDIVLHAVGIRMNEKGYCFLGTSGSGKSTLAAALTQIPGVEILGEDNIVLRYQNNQFYIYGTPWHLNSMMCSPNKVRLEKILFLDRTIEPGIEPCDPVQGITRILQTAFIPYYRHETLPGILQKLSLLSTEVPFELAHYQLGSDPGSLFE
jgi:hypothetical protein